jgi:hypothetical protein
MAGHVAPAAARILAQADAESVRPGLSFLRALGFGGSLGFCFGAMAAAYVDLRRRRPGAQAFPGSPTVVDGEAALAAARAVLEPEPGTVAGAGDAGCDPAPTEPMTVLVTSAEVDAGRTELAIDLATRGVHDGLRVLLIDGQPRRRTLTAAAARLMDGTTGYRTRQVRLGGHWRPVLPLFRAEGGEAFLIPSGMAPALGDPLMSDLTGFDLVVIDGPEAGQESLPLARQADRIVLADAEGRLAPDEDGAVEALFARAAAGPTVHRAA